MRKLSKDGKTVFVAQTKADAEHVLKLLREFRDETVSEHPGAAPVALDFETTALRSTDSVDARVRLTSISFADKTAYVIDHDKSIPFALMAEDLIAESPYFVFNANFEGRWFGEYVTDVTGLTRQILDIAHMQRAVMGGGPLWLKTMVKKVCGVDLDKTEQNSDWSADNLTAEQYFYSGLDSIYTREVAIYWNAEMSSDHWRGFYVINDAWRAVNECEDTGLLLDEAHHEKLIRMWERRRQSAETAFRKFVPESIVSNIRSKVQLSNMLKLLLDDDAVAEWPKTEKTAQLQTSRNILRSMSYVAPYPASRIMTALMVFNRADKYIGTYGETLLNKQRLSSDGRIHGRLNMAAAITGRFSSSNPNCQQFPRHPTFRYGFMAGRGRKLIIGDYSGVEIRVLAELSGDNILLHDAIYGDVHAMSAIAIYEVDAKEYLRILKHDPKKDPPLTEREKSLKVRYKEMRSKAKAFTFQLLYGAGPGALAIALRCTVDEAADAINKWAARYKKAYHYRQIMFEQMNHSGFLPCASGRTIFVHRNERSMPVAANYPIQGSAADVMYAALTRTQEQLDAAGIDAVLVASVHDELLVLSAEHCAEQALRCLNEGMRQGWLDIFEGSNTDHLADAEIGERWSDK